jgi:hypothetical protein
MIAQLINQTASCDARNTDTLPANCYYHNTHPSSDTCPNQINTAKHIKPQIQTREICALLFNDALSS